MKRLILTLSALLFSQCTIDEDLTDYQIFQPRLVVNGSISPQNGVYMEISPLLNPERQYNLAENLISDADLALFDDAGTFLDDIPFDDKIGAYSNRNFHLECNKYYTIKIEHGGFPNVTATVQIPDSVQNLQGMFVEYDNEDDESKIFISYDEPGREMFYRMYTKGFSEEFIIYPKDYAGQITPEVSPFFCNHNNPLYFDNSCLDQMDFHREVDLWLRRVRINDTISYDPTMYIYDSLQLVLESISSEYIEYAAYLDQIPEDLDLLFADQRKTPTNIKGGYGIIAAKNISTIKIYLP